MGAKILELRDAVAARIGQIVMPLSSTIVAKDAKSITAESLDALTDADKVLITLSAAAQQIEVTYRRGGSHRPIVAVGVHARVVVNSMGEPDQARLDDLIEYSELLMKRLASREFPDYSAARVVTIDMPILYDPAKLVENGIYQSVFLVTFHADYDEAD